MFADPNVLYHTAPTGATSAVALGGAGSGNYSFACIGRGPLSSSYRKVISATAFIDLTISRQIGKRNRFTARLTESELVPDPIDSSVNSLKTATLYVVADIGSLGTTTNWAKLNHMLAYLLYDPTDAGIVFDRIVAGET